jgi:hypothetical protein
MEGEPLTNIRRINQMIEYVPNLPDYPSSTICPYCYASVDYYDECSCGYPFTCEICGRTYDDPYEAEECSARCREEMGEE